MTTGTRLKNPSWFKSSTASTIYMLAVYMVLSYGFYSFGEKAGFKRGVIATASVFIAGSNFSEKEKETAQKYMTGMRF